MGQETIYYTFKEPTMNCKDMDARIRGVLLGHMGKHIHYDFSWKARAALVKRAKEVTQPAIDMLIRAVPDSFPILNACWHVFPEDTMDRLVTHPYWESDAFRGSVPQFMADYILKHGEKLLEKYEKLDMILANILARRPNAEYQTDGMAEERRGGSSKSPMTSPVTLLTYYKRYRSMPNKWRGKYDYEQHVTDNIGMYVMNRQIDLDPHQPRTTEVANEG